MVVHSGPYPWQVFKDGIVYHDYHFNGMQLAIAKELKRNYVDNHYSPRLLVHPNASYVWYDPLVDSEHIAALNGVQFDSGRLALTGSGSVMWHAIDLPEPITGVDVLWNAEAEDPGQIVFEVTFDGGLVWKPAPMGVWVPASDDGSAASTLRLRATLIGGADASPMLYDVAVFF